MSGTCVKSIENPATCQSCPNPPCAAYYDEETYVTKNYKNIGEGEINYSIILTDAVQNTPVCIDIRTVVSEIERGLEKYSIGAGRGGYLQPATGGVTLYYFDPENYNKLLEKEFQCLGTTKIQDKLVEKRNMLYPPTDASVRARRKDIFKALVLMVKLLLAVNPGQNIVHQNLSPAWREIYAQTTEYKSALSKNAIQVGAKSMYNPFDLTERDKILSPVEIKSDDEVMNRMFSTRLLKDPRLAGLEDKLLGIKNTGIWRRDKVRQILDADINLIKAYCVQCVLNKIVELESSDISISEKDTIEVVDKKRINKARKAYEFFKLMRNFRGATFIESAGAMFGNVCIRNQAVHMISIINQLKLIIDSDPSNSIPELDLANTSVDNEPPRSFRGCFYSLLTESPRHSYNLTTLIHLTGLETKELEKNANANANFGNSGQVAVNNHVRNNSGNSGQVAVNNHVKNNSGMASPGPKNLFRSNSSGGARRKTRKSKNTNKKRTKSQKRR